MSDDIVIVPPGEDPQPITKTPKPALVDMPDAGLVHTYLQSKGYDVFAVNVKYDGSIEVVGNVINDERQMKLDIAAYEVVQVEPTDSELAVVDLQTAIEGMMLIPEKSLTVTDKAVLALARMIGA